MSDQSLEEMLAALEGTTTNPRGGGQSFQASGDHGITDIDEFLNKLESDSAQNKPYSARVSQLVDDFDDLDLDSNRGGGRPTSYVQQPKAVPAAKPSPFGQKQAAAPPKAAPAPIQQQKSFPPKPQAQSIGGAGAPVDATGERLLLDEGYARHNNRGKLINYSKGKATDFRIKGTTSSRVGLIHVITLRALDDYGEPCQITEVNPRDFIGVVLTLVETGRDIQPWFKDNGDATYDIAFYCEHYGTAQLQIKLCGSPMFDISIQVDPSGDSLWVALLQNTDVNPHDTVIVAIVTADDSRPEGVVPFEVQTMGDISDLKLMNNGDGTYRFQCIPQSAGHCTINITLHEQPIQNSPIIFKVGQEQKAYIKQVATQAPPAFGRAAPAASRGPSQVQNPPAANRAPSHFQQPAGRAQQPQQATTSYARPQTASVNYGKPQQATYEQPGQRESYYGGGDSHYDNPADHYDQPDDGYDDVFDGEFAGGGNVTNDDLNRLLDELGGGM